MEARPVTVCQTARRHNLVGALGMVPDQLRSMGVAMTPREKALEAAAPWFILRVDQDNGAIRYELWKHDQFISAADDDIVPDAKDRIEELCRAANAILMLKSDAAVNRLARAICKSKTCEGYACCQWPASGGRTQCPVKNGGYDDAAQAAIAAFEAELKGRAGG